MKITAYKMAERFVNVREVPGKNKNNPFIMSMLQLDNSWPENDEVPWCSAFVNYVAWLLNVNRSKSLRARSWLQVGSPVGESSARRGWDVVILQRGAGEQPGPEVIKAPGHVGFFAGWDTRQIVVPDEDGSTASGVGIQQVAILGGNQGNTVNVTNYDAHRILGIRRIWEE